MDIFTEENLKALADVHETAVSIYMPTFTKGAGLQQNPVRYRNLIADAENQLVLMGLRPTEAADFMLPAKRLQNDGAFWKNMSDGLAVFISKSFFQTYRLPQAFHPHSIASYQFQLKPILTMLSGDTRFYVLILNIKGPQFFECSRFSIKRIDPKLLPGGLDETLGFDTQEKNVQFSSKPAIIGNNPTTVFGYGRQTDKTKVNIANYFHRINDAVVKILGPSNAPLITAGLEYHNPIYHEANTYHNLLPESIQSNLEDAAEAGILHMAWPIVQPHFQETERKTIAFFQQLKGKNSTVATDDLLTIVQGAVNGRIETLFIADGRTHKWGCVNGSGQTIEMHEQLQPGDEDLLDFAAVNTILKGGSVYVLKQEQVQELAEAAAILRF
jgi:hypothetical protein